MNPYNIDLTESNLEGPIVSLTILYDNIPETSGCENCEKENPGEKDWCCKTQNPSMYYVEFLNVFKEIGDRWDDEDKTDALLGSVRSYLKNNLNKGCIFYQGGCTIYDKRPFSCRMYGVVPEKSWEKRWEALKERQQENFSAKPQCSLVSAEEEITDEMEDKWFEHIKKCEERIGVDHNTIVRHDLAGGSYRTFHDHMMIEFFPEQILGALSTVRMTDPSDEDIDSLLEELRKQLNNEALSCQM